MGAKTAIEWTDHTFNPWRGCDKVSAGCDNCYMFREQRRYGRDPEAVVRCKSWLGPRKWNRDAELDGVQRRVFTCSWSDFFHKKADPWRDEAWELIRNTPHLNYQILTKRPALMAKRLPADWGDGYPNVWLGISAEDQATADQRIPLLLETPAVVRFVSAEPLLGPIDLRAHRKNPSWSSLVNAPEWIIVGGESGPKCRPMEIGWAESIVDLCRESGVPCFVKQLGGWPDKRGDISIFPPSLRVREYPLAGVTK